MDSKYTIHIHHVVVHWIAPPEPLSLLQSYRACGHRVCHVTLLVERLKSLEHLLQFLNLTMNYVPKTNLGPNLSIWSQAFGC